MVLQKISICALVLTVASCTQFVFRRHIATNQCAYYGGSLCKNDTGECPTVENCEHQRNYCFVIWKQTAAGDLVKLKGCTTNHDECNDQLECIDRRQIPKKDIMFCCCEGDMCNKEFKWDPTLTRNPNASGAKNLHQTIKRSVFIACKIIILYIVCGFIF